MEALRTIPGLQRLLCGQSCGTYDFDTHVLTLNTGPATASCRPIAASDIFNVEPDWGYQFRAQVIVVIAESGECFSVLRGGEDYDFNSPTGDACPVLDKAIVRLLQGGDLDALDRHIHAAVLDTFASSASRHSWRLSRWRAHSTPQICSEMPSGFLLLDSYSDALIKVFAEAGLVEYGGNSELKDDVASTSVAPTLRERLLDNLLLYESVTVIEGETWEDDDEGAPHNLLKPAISEGVVTVERRRLRHPAVLAGEYGVLSEEDIGDFISFLSVVAPFSLARAGHNADDRTEILKCLKNIDLLVSLFSKPTWRNLPESQLYSLYGRYEELHTAFTYLAPHLRHAVATRMPLFGVADALESFDMTRSEHSSRIDEAVHGGESVVQAYRIVLEEVDVFPMIRGASDVLRLRQDRRLQAFRKELLKWSETLHDGSANTEYRLRNQVREANMELRGLGKWRRFGAWVAYASLPVGAASALSGVPMGLVLTPVGLGIRIYVAATERRHRWLLLGR